MHVSMNAYKNKHNILKMNKLNGTSTSLEPVTHASYLAARPTSIKWFESHVCFQVL